jgi:hypothetical protein
MTLKSKFDMGESSPVKVNFSAVLSSAFEKTVEKEAANPRFTEFELNLTQTDRIPHAPYARSAPRDPS